MAKYLNIFGMYCKHILYRYEMVFKGGVLMTLVIHWPFLHFKSKNKCGRDIHVKYNCSLENNRLTWKTYITEKHKENWMENCKVWQGFQIWCVHVIDTIIGWISPVDSPIQTLELCIFTFYLHRTFFYLLCHVEQQWAANRKELFHNLSITGYILFTVCLLLKRSSLRSLSWTHTILSSFSTFSKAIYMPKAFQYVLLM